MNDLSDRFEQRVRAIAAELIDEAMNRLLEQLLAGAPVARQAPARNVPLRRTRSRSPRPEAETPAITLSESLARNGVELRSRKGRSGQPARDPLVLARRQFGPCMVFRCRQPHAADGYCAAHRAQADADGWPLPAPRSFRPPFKPVPLQLRRPDVTPKGE